MPARVQIVLPGLFDLPLEELEPDWLVSNLPHLNRLLRFATTRSTRSYSIDEIVKTTLGFDDPAGLPLAQAFALDEDQQPGHLLLAQAIHLQAGLHSAVVVPVQVNQGNLRDINNIINDLNDIFKVDCNISAVADGLFLVHLKEFAAPTHYPHILSVLGKTANPYIEQSRQNLPWYQLLNEIQMFMHQHEVNAERTSRGVLPINSLWCWGAGILPPGFNAKPAWYCDDPVLNQFARSLGIDPESCTNINRIDDSGDAILIDLRLIEFLKTGLAAELDQLLLDIDRKLLKPSLQAAAKGRRLLLLRAGYEFDFELKATARMKFWRPHKNLSSWTGNSPEL
ncbi:MAG: hypothetical protein KJN95_07905 [Gammaproteobacteria bacterium]|nr:hypothetical protein [Gammaproteobacteria bacterium]